MREMKDSGVEWIGEIPQNWTCLKLKHVIESCDGGVWGKDPTNTTLDKIVIRSTEQSVDGKWYISNPATRDLSGIKNLQRFRIQVGDLLMTKSSGSALHIGKTTLADEYFVENECYYSNFLQRIRLIINPQFAWYILNSSISREQFVYLQNSTSGIGNINAENISNIYIPVPNRDAQKMISDFLNAKCIKTDTLIQNVQTQIEKLKAYKQSLITEVVTKGLDPTVPMKDSGVDWIGEIPEHWGTMKLQYCARIRSGITLGKRYPVGTETIERPYLRVANVQSGGVVLDNVKTVEVSMADDLQYRLSSGEVLMTEGGDRDKLGRGCVWQGQIEPCLHQNHIFALQPNDLLDSQFLAYMTASNVGRVYFDITAIKTTNLACTNSSKVLAFRFPLPDKGEQTELVAYLDKKCAQIDRHIAIKQAEIEKLEQYKRSLIYEYVTGKKEVV